MASLTCDHRSGYVLQFEDRYGKRQTIRLPHVSKRQALEIKGKVEALNTAAIYGVSPNESVACWATSLDGRLADNLARVGLIPTRERATLGAFLESYLIQRGDVKPGTMIVFRQAQRWLVRFLGEDKPLASVNPGDADAYRAHLQAKGRARATVNKWCQYARHFFEVAKRRKLIEANPFAHIRGAVRGNLARRYIVPAADVHRLLEVIPDPQWRLLVVLARYGGLRIPSEALALRWSDVNFEQKRFTVRASKTERHEGGGIRVVPLFPELEGEFLTVFANAAEGEEYVISRYRDPKANLRTQLVRYIAQAGLKPWPKPWQNMRATRATELADQYPSHVCAAWLGHTEAVANEFYRQVTEDHFARASAPIKALHKALHYGAASSNKERQSPGACDVHTLNNKANLRSVPVGVAGCDVVKTAGMGAAGFEPATEGL